MKPGPLLSQVLRVFFLAMAAVLLVVMTVTGIGWWAGWPTEEPFKTAIQIAGLALIGTGFIVHRGLGSKTEAQSGPQESRADGPERYRKSPLGFLKDHSILLVMSLAGGLCLLIGWLM